MEASPEEVLCWARSLRRGETGHVSTTTTPARRKQPFKTALATDLDNLRTKMSVTKQKLAGSHQQRLVLEAANAQLQKQLTWAHAR
jgi:hypothetical protein